VPPAWNHQVQNFFFPARWAPPNEGLLSATSIASRRRPRTPPFPSTRSRGEFHHQPRWGGWRGKKKTYFEKRKNGATQGWTRLVEQNGGFGWGPGFTLTIQKTNTAGGGEGPVKKRYGKPRTPTRLGGGRGKQRKINLGRLSGPGRGTGRPNTHHHRAGGRTEAAWGGRGGQPHHPNRSALTGANTAVYNSSRHTGPNLNAGGPAGRSGR